MAIIEMLQLGVSRGKVPMLFKVFARFFGAKIPVREKKKVPGPWVDGKRTTVERDLLYLPGATHVKEMAAVMNEINKLQIGEWMLDYLNSDETSCCYIADGAESQQIDYLGQLLTRRVNGKIEIMALSLDALGGKTAVDQAAAFDASLEDVASMMLAAGLVDEKGANLLRRFLPTARAP